ncbi:hypothetical protein KEM60_01291 [Austwickia sp. TVS 96-490-7B]|uniref:PH domain-containing protein n=1 Tax=Austwickia sp. TVS 96-490-7B TaxID=2830843 RepID=UPI001C5814FA|nr:PH domain-containing protein [Austwickia sp. TVS 96-490-7B]MBW3085098.1 hypothetical protein [Austwickia sp. TVS 96-490-7B]
MAHDDWVEPPRFAERYLVNGEHCVVATRRHWVTLVEPWASVAAAFMVVSWITMNVDPRIARPVDFLWWLWFAVVGRAAYRSWDRSRTWFIATDRRLLLIYGILVRRVAMMPLMRVTDMSYRRSTLGWLLGYGTFVLESAGQQQALRDITFVPHPDVSYRRIVAQIFHRDGDDEEESAEEFDDEFDEMYDEFDVIEDRPSRGRGDPTSSLAMSEEESDQWRDRLARTRTSPGRSPSARTHQPGVQEWPEQRRFSWFGRRAQGRANPPERDGESLYRSEGR